MPEADWVRCREPGPMLEALGEALPLRKRLLFGAACCRRVAPLLTDDRASRAIGLVERFADGLAGPADLVAAQPDVRAAVVDAFAARYYAESDADFSSHPAYSLAGAVEAAVYAVGALFDEAAHGACPPTLEFSWATDRRPHQHAASAAAQWAGAFALWAYNPRRGEGRRSPGYKVERVVIRRVLWSEEEAQAALLREVVGPPNPPEVAGWRSEAVIGLARCVESGAWEALPVLADALEEAGCSDTGVLAHCRGAAAHVRGCWVIDLLLCRAPAEAAPDPPDDILGNPFGKV